MTLATAGGAWTGHSCRHEVKDEAAFSQQSISVQEADVSSSKTGSSVPAAHPCDLCGPVLNYILCLDEQETQHKPRASICEECGRRFLFSANFDQSQQHYSAKKCLRRGEGTLFKGWQSW